MIMRRILPRIDFRLPANSTAISPAVSFDHIDQAVATPYFGECTTGDQRVNGLLLDPIPAERFKHNAPRELTSAQNY